MNYKFSNAKIKKTVLFFIPTIIVYALMIFVTAPKLSDHSNGMKILDLMPVGYSPEYVQKLFETLGESGREIYLWQQIPLDLIYPALFAISFSLLIGIIFKNSRLANKTDKFILIPIFGALFDYLENIGIIIMLKIFPDFYVWLSNMTSMFTVLKSFFVTITFVLIIFGVIKKYKKQT